MKVLLLIRTKLILAIGALFIMSLFSHTYATIDCGTWRASNGSQTKGLVAADTIFWNYDVTFTLSGATKTGGAGSLTYPSGNSCTQSSSGSCSVSVKQGTGSTDPIYTCSSPSLIIETDKPKCGGWQYQDENGTWVNWTTEAPWSPIVSPSSPRGFRVITRDNGSVSSTVQSGFSGGLSSQYSYAEFDASLLVEPVNTSSGISASEQALASSNISGLTSVTIPIIDRAGNSENCISGKARIDGFAPGTTLLLCGGYTNGQTTYKPNISTTCYINDRGGPSEQTVLFRKEVYDGTRNTDQPDLIDVGTRISDTGFADPQILNRIYDTTTSDRITSGASYQTSIAPLIRTYVPELNKITKITARVCEFYNNTSWRRCTDSNSFYLVNWSELPPTSGGASTGAGWYQCSSGRLTWTSQAEDPGVDVWNGLDFVPSIGKNATFCIGDGTGNNEPKTQVIGYNGQPVGMNGTEACNCWDNQSPAMGTLIQSSLIWTNQPVNFAATATNDNGGSNYAGILYSCNNGITWNSLGQSTSTAYSCNTDSSLVQVTKVKGCDVAGNCSAERAVNFYKETTPPSVTFTSMSGTIHNHIGSGASADSISTLYTYTPTVSLNFTASDSGGSGLDKILFSCNATAPISSDSRWGTVVTSKVFNLTTDDGCVAGDGNKIVYIWTMDLAKNISTGVNRSIIYDATPPIFDVYSGKTLLLQATNSYIYTVINPSGGASGIRDHSIVWTEPSIPGYNTGIIDKISVLPLDFDLGDIAKFVNGKRSATITINLEDNAGNITTKTQNIDIIAKGIISGTHTTRSLTESDAIMVADRGNSYYYRMILKDEFSNIIRPVDNIREIQTDWVVNNTARFINGSSGAVWYKWDDYVLTSDNYSGNSFGAVYTGGTNKTTGEYNLQILSTAPTKQAYLNYTNNEIKVSKLSFKNALPSPSMATIDGCPVNYICTGNNTNVTTFVRDLGDVAALAVPPTGDLKKALEFKPILEVTFSKGFNTMTDNAWHPMSVTFKNNSSTQPFILDEGKMNFQYSNSGVYFADGKLRGGIGVGNSTVNSTSQSISFTYAGGIIGSGSSITRSFEFSVNSNGYGFGSFGFTSFIPYMGPSLSNTVNSLYPTGYNVYSLGINSTPSVGTPEVIPPGGFVSGVGVSAKQEITIQGLIGDNKKGLMSGTLKDAISIDTSKINKIDFKTNIKRNVEVITRNLVASDSLACNATLLPADLSSKDLYYYDFSNLYSTSPINGNNGCTLTIGTGGSPSSYGILNITGKKTIIVRGGNIKIKTDMKYGNANSMLALVVLRSDVDKSRGGNILIDPDVTNIVGGVYAEGSIMSYDDSTSTVYDDSNTLEGMLSKQLLWYGSIFSSNSVGGGFLAPYECPFDSDTYQLTKIKACSKTQATRYDLAFLRRFVLINGGSGSCGDSSKMAAKLYGTGTTDYAFAGKKLCYGSDTVATGLRVSDKTNPVIIEYNPAIQSTGMKIFSAQ